MSYNSMCGSCFSQALSSFVGEAAPPTQQGATLHLVPYGGLAPSATPLLRNAAPLYGYTVYIACQALDSFAGAADKVSPVRLYVADNGPHSAGCAPLSALWCRQQGLNLQAPGYEPGVLPLNYSDTMAGISASGRTMFRATHMQDAGSVPQEV